jgi:hypothetical protein
MMVCGMPTSGNRAIAKALRQVGFYSSVIHPVQAVPPHPGCSNETHFWQTRDAVKAFSGNCERTHAVWPVRSMFYQHQSVTFGNMFPPTYERPEVTSFLFENMPRVLRILGIPWRAVSYEAWAERPVDETELLVGWAGRQDLVPSVREADFSWVMDGNEKYRETHGEN